jgi:hypothetical protein
MHDVVDHLPFINGSTFIDRLTEYEYVDLQIPRLLLLDS